MHDPGPAGRGSFAAGRDPGYAPAHPRAVSRGGYGNAVAVGAADVYRAAGMLRGALVLFDKCYRVSPQGGAEEVFP